MISIDFERNKKKQNFLNATKTEAHIIFHSLISSLIRLNETRLCIPITDIQVGQIDPNINDNP